MAVRQDEVHSHTSPRQGVRVRLLEVSGLRPQVSWLFSDPSTDGARTMTGACRWASRFRSGSSWRVPTSCVRYSLGPAQTPWGSDGLIRRVPIPVSATLPRGESTCSGRVACDEPPLEAPFSGRRCVIPRRVIETLARQHEGQSMRQIRGLGFRTKRHRDGTARIRFRIVGSAPAFGAGPRFVDCAHPARVSARSGLFKQLKPRMRDLLSTRAGNKPVGGFRSRLRGPKDVIQVGDIRQTWSVTAGCRVAPRGCFSRATRAARGELRVEGRRETPR